MKFLVSVGVAAGILSMNASFGQSVASRLTQQIRDAVPQQVENSYTRGLRYLKTAQQNDGSWNDMYGREPGVVGLCVLAMLAHGDDPNVGPYKDNIKKSIDFILKAQTPNGYIGNSMYNHGFATLALAECYGMIKDERIGKALKKAVELILSAQKRNARGAWRYTPDSNDADTTVTGCQIVALYAARNAGINVPDEVFKKGLAYLRSCQSNDGSVGYTSKGSGRVTLTAITVLSFALSREKDSEVIKKGMENLKKNLTYRDDAYPMYFEYYMSQALFQADENVWRDWNDRNMKFLSAGQLPDGSWDLASKGKSFCTAAGCLSLALNYRFLPIYEK